MRRWRRLAGVMLLDGFRAAPGWMSVVTGMLVLGGAAATCYPLGYRMLLDGALAGSWGQAAWGVAIVAGLMSIGWVLLAIGASEAMALSDRISVYQTARQIDLIGSVAGVEHLERPDYLAQVERLNANRRQLAGAPRQVLSNLSNAARIVVLVTLLGTVSPWLVLLPVCALPPIVADRIAKRLAKQAEDAAADTRRLAGAFFALATGAGAAGEVRAYGLAPHLAAEHERLSTELDRRGVAQALRVLAVQGAGWLMYAAALMGAVAFVVVRATQGAITLGTVLMTVSLIRRSRTQLAATAASSGALVNTLATADRLFWLEDHAAASAAQAGTRPAPDRLGEGIELRGVRFTYPGTERPVLDDVSLRLPAGATVALVGENGSGKTTLVKLLLAMYRPDAGQILVDGHCLDDLDPAHWRAAASAAFQDFSRFHLPAVEAIGLADLPGLDDAPAAAAALERAGAADLADQLPDGLATRVGSTFTGGHGLSGGQWQKLALGRAMRREQPLLLVLDEPTASLDAQAEHALFERYAQAAARTSARTGAITVLVSHRLATARSADLIVFLEQGRVVEVGSHQQLTTAGSRYAELFELQAAAYR